MNKLKRVSHQYLLLYVFQYLLLYVMGKNESISLWVLLLTTEAAFLCISFVSQYVEDSKKASA